MCFWFTLMFERPWLKIGVCFLQMKMSGCQEHGLMKFRWAVRESGLKTCEKKDWRSSPGRKLKKIEGPQSSSKMYLEGDMYKNTARWNFFYPSLYDWPQRKLRKNTNRFTLLHLGFATLNGPSICTLQLVPSSSSLDIYFQTFDSLLKNKGLLKLEILREMN